MSTTVWYRSDLKKSAVFKTSLLLNIQSNRAVKQIITITKQPKDLFL